MSVAYQIAMSVTYKDIESARKRLDGIVKPTPMMTSTTLDQMIGAEPLMAVQALGQRVGERLDVAARLPDLAGEDHARVQADDVVAFLDHVPPPLALDVVLQLHAEGTVVPRGTQTTVDVTGRVDESTSLAQVDNGIEAVTA